MGKWQVNCNSCVMFLTYDKQSVASAAWIAHNKEFHNGKLVAIMRKEW